jgi:hypothetical protein
MIRTRAGWCLPALMLTWAVGIAAAGDASEIYRPVYLPGGTADAGGRTGYVTNADGGIDAVNLETGTLLWATKEARRPLVAFADRLAAWAPVPGKGHHLRVLVFATADKGKRVLASDPVVFPEWVSVEPTLGRTFAAHAEVVKGALLLHWEAHASYAGGAPPPPEVIAAAKKDATGTARISVETGKVEMLGPDKGQGAGGPRLPEALQKATSRQYWTGSSWETRPLMAGKVVAALDQQVLAGQKQKLTLKRWDLASGKALEPVELLVGKELWPQLQPDGRYVFVHQALVKEQLPPGDYAWWVFSLETGKQVGKVPFEAGTAGMSVLGPRVYNVAAGPAKGPRPGGFALTQPRVLRALALPDGKRLWERPIEPVRRMIPPP